jgi:3-phosphoglycerate kinase
MTIHDLDVQGKKALMRIDFNVPVKETGVVAGGADEDG